MKQTALDWYFDKIKSHFEHDGDLFEAACFTFAIAKQKEKQQIEESYKHGQNNGYMYGLQKAIIIDSEQYYNSTYNS